MTSVRQRRAVLACRPPPTGMLYRHALFGPINSHHLLVHCGHRKVATRRVAHNALFSSGYVCVRPRTRVCSSPHRAAEAMPLWLHAFSSNRCLHTCGWYVVPSPILSYRCHHRPFKPIACVAPPPGLVVPMAASQYLVQAALHPMQWQLPNCLQVFSAAMYMPTCREPIPAGGCLSSVRAPPLLHAKYAHTSCAATSSLLHIVAQVQHVPDWLQSLLVPSAARYPSPMVF